MKCDGESAIRAVREALAKYHGGKMIPEGPPKGESQSNGVIEEAGKTIREFVRVYKDQVEEKAGIKLDSDEVIILWMIRWAAMVCSRYLVGKDGKTAYERRKGRKCTDKVAAIGEKVWYRKVRHGKERVNQLEVEWEEGIWLGRARESNETIIGTADGVLRAYAIKRMDPDERWDGEAIKRLQGTPQQPDPSKPGVRIPVRVTFDPMEEAEPSEAREARREKELGRRMRITKPLLEHYGYSEDCEGCRRKRAGMDARLHTDRCRARLWDDMKKDDYGRVLVEREHARIDEKC